MVTIKRFCIYKNPGFIHLDHLNTNYHSCSSREVLNANFLTAVFNTQKSFLQMERETFDFKLNLLLTVIVK